MKIHFLLFTLIATVAGLGEIQTEVDTAVFQPANRIELKAALGTCCDNNASAFDNECTYDGVHIRDWDTSQVEDFSELFLTGFSGNSCYRDTFNADVSQWDVSSGTNFSQMFYNARAFNQDISLWDVSKGADFQGMFDMAISFNQKLSQWQVSSDAYVNRMFKNTNSLVHFESGWTRLATRQGTTDMYTGSCSDNPDCGKCNKVFLPHDYFNSRLDDVACSVGKKANYGDQECVNKNCVDDNSLCCETPCPQYTSATACATGSDVCWWDADVSQCQRGCTKPIKDETNRVCYGSMPATGVTQADVDAANATGYAAGQGARDVCPTSLDKCNATGLRNIKILYNSHPDKPC